MSESQTEVQVKGEDRPDEVVSIGRPVSGSDGFNYVSVRIEADGLSCSRGALMYGDDGISAFFGGLAQDWRGWDGTRHWNTIEQELTIDASHSGRRIELVFTLFRDFGPSSWRVVLAISIPPDESLDRLASDVQALFGDLQRPNRVD